MKLKLYHVVLMTVAFISTTAVAIFCPEKSHIPNLGDYYLCTSSAWGTDCGIAYNYDSSGQRRVDIQGLLWSRLPCVFIGAIYAEGYEGCTIFKQPQKHRECFFGHTKNRK